LVAVPKKEIIPMVAVKPSLLVMGSCPKPTRVKVLSMVTLP